MSELLSDLAAYDGKAVTLLSEAEARHGARPGYLSELVAMSACQQAQVCDGATWLLKASAEKGKAPSAEEIGALIDTLPKISSWPAQLHICQMVGLISVPAASAAALADWLSGLLRHERPFIRAWSMSALSSLARQHAEYAAQAAAALQAAKVDGSASVRARARNVEKQGPV